VKKAAFGQPFFCRFFGIDCKYFKENFLFAANLFTFGEDENRKNAKANYITTTKHQTP